jgi:hypothetical protein
MWQTEQERLEMVTMDHRVKQQTQQRAFKNWEGELSPSLPFFQVPFFGGSGSDYERARALASLQRYHDYCVYPTVCKYFKLRISDNPLHISTTSWRRPEQEYLHKFCMRGLRGNIDLLESCTDKQEADLTYWAKSKPTLDSVDSENQKCR